MQTNNRMFVIGTIVIGIGALLIPGMNLAPGVFAGKIQVEDIHQHIDQANLSSGEGTSCSNSATNEAVSLAHEGLHITVHQHIDQANLCSGEGTSCSNSATNKWSPANFQH
jgi:hypothetical protein